MRKATLLCFLILFSFPVETLAANKSDVPPLVPDKCSQTAPMVGPDVSRTFRENDGTKAPDVQRYLNDVMACPSACYNVSLALSVNEKESSLTFTTILQNTCADASKSPREQNPPRSCEQNPPTATIITPELGFLKQVFMKATTISNKSRCDLVKLGSLVTIFNKLDNARKDWNGAISIPQDLKKLAALPEVQSFPPIEPQVGSTARGVPKAFDVSEEAVKLGERMGLPRDVAEQFAKYADETSPAIKCLLGDVNNCDRVQAGQTLYDIADRAGFEVNEDVKQNIKRLGPDIKEALEQGGEVKFQFGDNTFTFRAEPVSTSQADVACPPDCTTMQKLLMYAHAETRNGKTPVNPSADAQGEFQITRGWWTHYSKIFYPNNPELWDPKHRSDPYWSGDLLSKVSENVYTDLAKKYAPPDMKTHVAEYLPHPFGEGGAKHFFKEYKKDPDQSAAEVMGDVLEPVKIQANKSVYYDKKGNARTLAGVAAEYERRMSGAPVQQLAAVQLQGGAIGGVIPRTDEDLFTPSPAPVPSSVYRINGQMYLSYDSKLIPLNPSPFAQESVIYCKYVDGRLICPVGTATEIGRPTGGGLPSLGGGGGGSRGGGSGGGGSSYVPPPPPPAPAPAPAPQPTPPPPKAVAVLIAQPSQVARGGTITVSWSSVGMSASAPCQIRLEVGTSTSAFAGGNEGSKQFGTNASTTPGTQKFILQCTAQTGEAVEQSATVTII